MMRNYSLVGLMLTICFFAACTSQNTDCFEDLNLLPRYGQGYEGIKKCDEQIKKDQKFIAECDKQFKSRKEAVQFHLQKAWEFYDKKDHTTAMKRFNQAWLLDSVNADAYWGFAILRGVEQEFDESLYFFEKSLKINPDNPRVWHSASISYGSLFMKTKDPSYLQKGINCLKNAVLLDGEDPVYLAHLSAAFAQANQRDSVVKYWTLTKKINPEAKDSDVEKILGVK